MTPKELQNKYKEIKGFFQHGFVPEQETGSNQLVGNCIFCGKKGHFYINPDKKMWDCKKCSKSGGFKTFLKEVSQWSLQFFEKTVAGKLSRDRVISLKVFRENKVGFNPITNEYIIPCFDQNGEDIYDLKRYTKKGFFSTAGCRKSIHNWEAILEAETIWLCEGEWDEMKCSSYIDNEKTVAVSVPGADIFMNEWAGLFLDKKVIVAYDNDDAGKRGARKAHAILSSLVKEVKYIHWPDDSGEGYDLRDYCIEHNEMRSLKPLDSLMRNYPPGADEETKSTKEEKKKQIFKGPGIDYKEVYKEFQAVFYMKDTTILDVIYGTIIANRLDGDPLWLFVVGPPGSLKTELLMSLVNSPAILTTTSVTPHSLVSGANFSGGGDPSLIPRLNDKVLVIKDFTTILNMNPMARDDIFGILRDAYDGRTEKIFGNGVTRVYESKFGIIAGTTPAIELYLEGNAAMGERFLSYHIPIVHDLAEQKQMVRRAMGNVGKEKDKRERLKNVSHKVLNYNFDTVPVIQEEYIVKIICLAQFISAMRGTVVRDKYTKEITHKPFTEYATRLSKQLLKLLIGICMFKKRKEVCTEDFDIVKGIARSTVPSRMLELVRITMKAESSLLELQQYSNATGLPKNTCERALEDLTILRVLEKDRTSRLSVRWRLRKDIVKLLKGADLYE